MTWFTEDSTPLIVIGVVIEALLLLGFVKTSRLGLLYAMAAVAIVVGAGVWIEKHTDTDTKRITRVLDAATVAVEKKNMPGLLALIAPSAAPLRAQVTSEFGELDVRDCYLRGLKITINRFNNPPTAKADFVGHVDGKLRHGLLPDGHYFAQFEVTLHLDNGHWLVNGYQQQLGPR